MIRASLRIAASFPPPRFYEACREDLRISEDLFAQVPQVKRCRAYIRERIPEELGHGVAHAEKVAVEAGALAYREGAGLPAIPSLRRETAVLAQIAGLLHDLCRGEKDHARAGAHAAETVLRSFSLEAETAGFVQAAIANHEAFTEPRKIAAARGQMVSDALYDADKFRWGPDNFTTTLWKMLRFSGASIPRLIPRFPKGMEGIRRVRGTFRTATGKEFGPEFIDLGLRIGEEIQAFLQERYAGERSGEEGEKS
jgi:hypothetical protein